MPLSVVQAQNNEVTTGAAVTVTISTTAGNLLVLLTSEGQNNSSTVTISDSAGQTWTQVNGYVSSNATNQAAMWYKENSVAVTSVTATWSGGISTRISGMVFEISGAALSGSLDVSVTDTNTGSVTTETSGSLTTTNANDILIYGVRLSSNQTSFTAGSGYTIPTNGSANRLGMEYQIVSSVQSGVTASISWSTAGNVDGFLAAFKAAASSQVFFSLPDDGEQFRSAAPANPNLLALDEWLPRVPQPPLFEWDESQRWQLNRDMRVSWATGEEDTGFLPIIPKVVYDDDPSRSFEARSQQDDEPWHTFFTIPIPPPTLGWDDWDWSRDYSTLYVKPPDAEPFDFIRPIVPSLGWFEESQQMYGLTGLSALVVLDEFVNAPAGSIQFGPAPLGRSIRFGFSISAFR